MAAAAATVALVATASTTRAQGAATPDSVHRAGVEARRAAVLDSLAADAARRLELRRRWEEGDRTVPDSIVLHRTTRLTPLDAALLIRSGRAPADGNRLLRLEAESPFRMGMFYLHDIMVALLYAGERLEPETRAAIRESLRTQPLYRGDTENHWLLYHTGLLLASEAWPGEPGPSWFNGKSSEENAREAREWIEIWMRGVVTEGQMEFDSPNYLTTFLAPLLTLRDHARDSTLRRGAAGMLEWILADYAVESLDGLYAGGHSRDYPWHATAPQTAPNMGWGWLYFGEGPMAWRSEYLPVAALASWVPPTILADIARDRSVPYEHRERKRVRNVLRYGDELNPRVYKTTWMTSAFALGSLQGGVLQPIQQHTWDVTYTDDDGGGSIFFLHPYFAGTELATFFPEEPEWLTDQVNRFHTTYTDPDKWVASSPWERVFQHRNALIALYDLPDTARHGHIDGYFPADLARREVDPSGWIFAQGGDAYVAVRPLRTGEWRREPDGSWRFRSSVRRNGVVVEAAAASEVESWEAWKARVRAAPVIVSEQGALGVRYVGTAGDTLDFAFPDERRLNGAAVDLAETPLFEGPFVSALRGRMVLRHAGRERIVAPLPVRR